MTHHRSTRSPSWAAKRWTLLAVVAWTAFPLAAAADDCLQPTESVTTGVTLRAQPTTQSTKVGILRPGESLPLVATVPNWYGTHTASGDNAWVSKRWVVATACQAPPSSTPPPPGAPAFTVDVFDVGTGLSVLVRGADFSLLYDAGSNDDLATGAGNRVVAYLKAAAPPLTSLNHVMLSHPHRDHVELMADVVRQYAPKDVWDSGSRGNMIAGYCRFLEAVAAGSGIRYHTATQIAGDEALTLEATCTAEGTAVPIVLHHGTAIDSSSIALGDGASMQILHADGTSYTSAQNPNRNSLVVRFTLGGRHVLFMGDAPGGGRAAPTTAPDPNSIEASLLACCSQELFSDAMIVGHHGSETSSRSAFIDAVGASIYAISSGPKQYGTTTLPDDVIVQALKARGQVFRTDANDDACKTATAKIGPDNDGSPGGCDAIRISIPAAGPVTAAYVHGSD